MAAALPPAEEGTQGSGGSFSSLQSHSEASTAGTMPLLSHSPQAWQGQMQQKREVAVWFMALRGRPMGPVTRSDILAHLHRGELTQDNLVWRAGWPSWVAAHKVVELQNRPSISQDQILSALTSAEQEIDDVLSQLDFEGSGSFEPLPSPSSSELEEEATTAFLQAREATPIPHELVAPPRPQEASTPSFQEPASSSFSEPFASAPHEEAHSGVESEWFGSNPLLQSALQESSHSPLHAPFQDNEWDDEPTSPDLLSDMSSSPVPGDGVVSSGWVGTDEEMLFFERASSKAHSSEELSFGEDFELPPLSNFYEADDIVDIDDDDILEAQSFQARGSAWGMLAGIGLLVIFVGVGLFVGRKVILPPKTTSKSTLSHTNTRSTQTQNLTLAQRKARCRLNRVGCEEFEILPERPKAPVFSMKQRRTENKRRRKLRRISPAKGRDKGLQPGSSVTLKAAAPPTKRGKALIADIYKNMGKSEAFRKRLRKRGISIGSSRRLRRANRAPAGVDPAFYNKLVDEIARKQGMVKHCYEKHLRKQTQAGTLLVELKILPSGRVKRAKIHTAKFRGSTLAKCIRRDMQHKWRFASFSGVSAIRLMVPYKLQAQF